MIKKARPRLRARPADAIANRKQGPAFAFVLDELDDLEPHTRPMFGCTALYLGERIVIILRERPSHIEDNGVWIATTAEHHASLRRELPSLRSILVLNEGRITGWQNIPVDGPDFEEEVLRACALVRAGDPRIGKVPKRKTPSTGKRKPARTASKAR